MKTGDEDEDGNDDEKKKLLTTIFTPSLICRHANENQYGREYLFKNKRSLLCHLYVTKIEII